MRSEWLLARARHANRLCIITSTMHDDDEQVVSTVKRGEYYRSQSKYMGLYLRSAEMFIINDRGQFWVPIRTLDKRIAPGGLDYSAGGHVAAGEGYEIGLIRETEEELGLKLQSEDLRFVATFMPREGDLWFRKLFLYNSNEVPDYNTEDFSGYNWMYPRELFGKLVAGAPAKTSMLVTVEKVLQLDLG